MNQISGIIDAIEQGDIEAAEQLLPLAYDELRHMAAAKMASANPRPSACITSTP